MENIANHDYKVEPIPNLGNKLLNSRSIHVRSAEMVQKIIENESKAGWEFLDIKTIRIPIRRTFLRSATEKTVSLIVFRRSRPTGNPEAILKQDPIRQFGAESLPSLGPATKD